jgi:hypothetical protein
VDGLVSGPLLMEQAIWFHKQMSGYWTICSITRVVARFQVSAWN